MFVPRLRPLASWSCALAWVVVLGVSGCQKHGSQGEDGKSSAAGDEAGSGDGPSAASTDDRIPELDAGAVGLHPGYVDGALLYASWRAGVMQELLQSVPLTPRDAKELAEVGAVLGVDPRVGDVLGHLGVAPDARVSLSVRPVVTWGAELREALEHDSSALDELTGSGGGGAVVAEVPGEPVADNEGGPPELEAEPVELSPAAHELERKARSLGVHLRVHLPVAEPAKLAPVLELFARQLRGQRWASTCASLGQVRACGGSSDSIVVLRDVAGGVQLDVLLTFISDHDKPDDPLRRAAIQQALAVPAASSAPRVAALRGDAVLLVDGPGVVSALRAASLARTITSLRDYGSEGYGIERLREREQALRQLHETERMFEGVSVELVMSKDRVLATGRWLPTDYGRSHMAEVFELSEIDADVPSLAALCDGALICGRSRGVPDRARFASLATGVYDEPLELGELLDDHEEEAFSVLLLETWPNALGSLARLPGAAISGPEAFVVQNMVDVGARILGFGFSVRSLQETRRSLTGDWVAYARMSAADLSAIGGFLQLAEARLSPADIPEVKGRVELTRLPDDDLPGNFYAIYDPSAATGDWGWAVLADGDDRVRWLAGLPHDDGAVPLLYLEVGDLWRLVASFEDGREELGFAQSWLSRRWVRGQVSRAKDGSPQVRVAMGKLD